MVALIQSSDIHSARLLVEQGMLDEAFEVLRRGLEICKARIDQLTTIGQRDMQAIDDRTALIEGIGGMAFEFLLNSELKEALNAVDFALSTLPSTFLHIYRAHVLMFLDRKDEARPIYVRCRREKVDAERTGEILILQDFASLREAGLSHPLIEEIEELFGKGNQSL